MHAATKPQSDAVSEVELNTKIIHKGHKAQDSF